MMSECGRLVAAVQDCTRLHDEWVASSPVPTQRSSAKRLAFIRSMVTATAVACGCSLSDALSLTKSSALAVDVVPGASTLGDLFSDRVQANVHFHVGWDTFRKLRTHSRQALRAELQSCDTEAAAVGAMVEVEVETMPGDEPLDRALPIASLKAAAAPAAALHHSPNNGRTGDSNGGQKVKDEAEAAEEENAAYGQLATLVIADIRGTLSPEAKAALSEVGDGGWEGWAQHFYREEGIHPVDLPHLTQVLTAPELRELSDEELVLRTRAWVAARKVATARNFAELDVAVGEAVIVNGALHESRCPHPSEEFEEWCATACRKLKEFKGRLPRAGHEHPERSWEPVLHAWLQTMRELVARQAEGNDGQGSSVEMGVQ